MRNVLATIVMTLTLFTLAACGGGGGGGTLSPQAKTIANLTIDLTGTLPANTAISGAAFTLSLPTNVTPLITNNTMASGVVSLSGTFAGGTQTPPVYTAATASTLGTIQMTLVNALPSGITQVGEVATVTLQLASGATPIASDFSVSSVNVIDAVLYAPISGMGVRVASVTLQ